MGRGTDRLYTMWTPLDDVTVEMGTLAVCEASHALPQFDRLQDTYGNVDVEQIGLKGRHRQPELTTQSGLSVRLLLINTCSIVNHHYILIYFQEVGRLSDAKLNSCKIIL